MSYFYDHLTFWGAQQQSFQLQQQAPSGGWMSLDKWMCLNGGLLGKLPWRPRPSLSPTSKSIQVGICSSLGKCLTIINASNHLQPNLNTNFDLDALTFSVFCISCSARKSKNRWNLSKLESLMAFRSNAGRSRMWTYERERERWHETFASFGVANRLIK